MNRTRIVTLTALSLASGSALSQEVFTASGPDAASILATVDAFRGALGNLNANEPCTLGTGRREINWDAAPDGVSAPNLFPGDFFNFTSAPRARGIVFTTPGTGLMLSAKEATGVGVNFANIDPSYAGTFKQFSPERLFTPIGSNVVDATFKIPGRQTDGASAGFGAVFTDVDLVGSSIEFFDASGVSLGVFQVPAFNGGFSFLGVVFDDAIVARVRIVSGNTPIGAGVSDNPTSGIDVAVMDDFVFGEPTFFCPADVNGSRSVDSDDFWDYLDMFSSGDACADLTHNGSTDADDFFAFLDAFSQGC